MSRLMKHGRSASTPANIERAKRLREGGLKYKEIAELMGTHHPLVWRWVNDIPRPSRSR